MGAYVRLVRPRGRTKNAFVFFGLVFSGQALQLSPVVASAAAFVSFCDDGFPRLITNVETAPAPSHDRIAMPAVHGALAEKGLLPATHIVDTLYADAHAMLEAQEGYGVNLLGPVRANSSWQASTETGFSGANFDIDWEQMEATGPEGKKSSRVRTKIRRGREVLEFRFSAVDCGKNLTVASKEHHEAQRLARKRQRTPEFEQEYANRQGIEDTFSRAVRANGFRHTRYRGLTRTHLQHTLTAAALNFTRVVEWWSGPSPRPSSPFVELMYKPTG